MLKVSFYQVWPACSSRHDIQKYCFCTRFSEFQSTFSFVYFIIKCRNFSNFVVVGFFIRLVFSPAVSFPYTMLYKRSCIHHGNRWTFGYDEWRIRLYNIRPKYRRVLQKRQVDWKRGMGLQVSKYIERHYWSQCLSTWDIHGVQKEI